MKRCAALWVVPVVFAAWAVAEEPTKPSAAVRIIKLSATYMEFAFHPQRGDLVGIVPSADTATLYPRAYLDGQPVKPVGPIKVGKTPTSLVFKQYKDKAYYVISFRKESSLLVVDAATLKTVKRIRLAVEDASELCAPIKPDDPYVYYCFGDDHGCGVGRARVDRLVDEGALRRGHLGRRKRPLFARTVHPQRTQALPPGPTGRGRVRAMAAAV